MNTDKTLISIKNAGKAYGQRVILRNVDLDINRGDFLAVTGPNGGGKTTLLRILLKLLKPSSGEVDYCQRFLMGYLPQKSAIDSRFPITVREVIASGLMGKDMPQLPKSEITAKVEKMIGRLELLSHADNPIGDLSGGQLQRTLLGRALVGDPDILVLDEPLSYLDKHFEQVLYSILDEFHKGGGTIVLVSHEMSAISNMATRHIMVDREVTVCHSHSHIIHCDCDDC